MARRNRTTVTEEVPAHQGHDPAGDANGGPPQATPASSATLSPISVTHVKVIKKGLHWEGGILGPGDRLALAELTEGDLRHLVDNNLVIADIEL